MSPLTIDIDDMNTSFQPGQTVRGQAAWRLSKEPKKAVLRLLWYTAGKGTEDVGVVQAIEFDNPAMTDSRRYEFKLPEGPYSFSGQLISLIWSLELHIGNQFVRQDITVSPGGREIKLYPEAVA